MKTVIVLVVLALAAVGYKYWMGETERAASLAATSPRGFVAMPAVQGASVRAVLVVAAEDCPEEESRRADDLADQLDRMGIPVKRVHEVDFVPFEPGDFDLKRIDKIMSGVLPIVFVRDKAKSNPSLNEIVAEYNDRGAN